MSRLDSPTWWELRHYSYFFSLALSLFSPPFVVIENTGKWKPIKVQSTRYCRVHKPDGQGYTLYSMMIQSYPFHKNAPTNNTFYIAFSDSFFMLKRFMISHLVLKLNMWCVFLVTIWKLQRKDKSYRYQIGQWTSEHSLTHARSHTSNSLIQQLKLNWISIIWS